MSIEDSKTFCTEYHRVYSSTHVMVDDMMQCSTAETVLNLHIQIKFAYIYVIIKINK